MGLLRSLQDAHDLAACHLLQKPRLVRIQKPEGLHRHREIAELAPDDGAVVLESFHWAASNLQYCQ